MQAIVTGGAIRVGKAISLALAKAGYDIILVYNGSTELANQVATQIKALDRVCHIHKCDLGKKENIDKLFADISKKYDDIKLLVNNASVFEKYSFMETSEEVFDKHFSVNLKAPFFLTQNFTRYINKRPYIESGHVVNILDIKVSSVNTGHFVYHQTKKALNDFTKMAAVDLAPKIRVNSISPGTVLPNKSDDDAGLDLSKYPKLKELTEAIINLDSSKSLTGQNIVIEKDPNL